jgi:plasmid stability protein
MEQPATVEKDGVQIKVWVSEGLYDWLRAQASRNHTSVAAEARRLMHAGMAAIEGLDALRDDVIALQRYLELHLEKLAWMGAVDIGTLLTVLGPFVAGGAEGKSDEEKWRNFLRLRDEARQDAAVRLAKYLREEEGDNGETHDTD